MKRYQRVDSPRYPVFQLTPKILKVRTKIRIHFFFRVMQKSIDFALRAPGFQWSLNKRFLEFWRSWALIERFQMCQTSSKFQNRAQTVGSQSNPIITSWVISRNHKGLRRLLGEGVSLVITTVLFSVCVKTLFSKPEEVIGGVCFEGAVLRRSRNNAAMAIARKSSGGLGILLFSDWTRMDQPRVPIECGNLFIEEHGDGIGDLLLRALG